VLSERSEFTRGGARHAAPAQLSSLRLTVPRVLVAIVSWNSAAHLGSAIASVPAGVPVVVVDNGSTDSSVEVARRAGARVIEAGENLGFGPGCNRAAKEGAPSETILFLNPDAALVDGERTLAALLAALDEDPRVAAVAPRLQGEGQELFQLRRLPSARGLAREAFLLDRLLPRNRGLRRDRYLDADRATAFDVEQPAGAALLVRRDAFESLAGFDSAFRPAWFEDVDLCARLLASGRRIRFVPAARATHVGGVAMQALAYRDFRPVYVRNLFRYLNRHASLSTRLVARGVTLAGAALRLILIPFVRPDHPRRDAARAHARVLRGLLGLGWRSALLPEGGRA
jgi:N-acetylglucosaminyl-diphospho-decaprenol L-rhamnosyltransferase